MIDTTKKDFEDACKKVGMSIEEGMMAVLAESGDILTVDETSPFYPDNVRIHHSVVTEGVGTELKKILKAVGITASPGCSCNKRARTMDNNGIPWAEENIDIIVGWLREEAERRGMPFVDIGGRALVKMAIKRAKKNIDK